MSVKETISEWATKIMGASKILDGLEARLREHELGQRQAWRHVPIFTNLEFVVPPSTENRMGLLEQNWLNGGEDVYLQGVMVSVRSVTGEQYLKTGAGFSIAVQEDGVQILNSFGLFDFAWNLRSGRTGQQLLSPANNSVTLSSNTLRKDRAGKVHWFSAPWKVAAGDNLLAQVKPLRVPMLPYAAAPVPSAIQDIRVDVALYGFRTGERYVG